MKKKKCYIYTRVSTAAQTEGYSLEAQKERLRQFAEYKDLEISGEYCDAGRFGHSIKGRPSFMEMLDDITAEKDGISFVLVYKLSRFGRNAADVLKSMQLLMDYDYQYTAEKVNLTAKMEEVFYTESVGNPFVASTLYKVVQDDAIISQKEKFGITDVRRISREKMGITAKMRSNMLAGIDVELNAYQHLWEAATSMDRLPDPKKSKETRHYTFGEDYNTMVTEISSRLEQAGVSINEARSYARQAIGAYPDDHNIDILYGYAMALYKATAKPE